MEEVDISLALSSAAFAVKDENELVGGPEDPKDEKVVL